KAVGDQVARDEPLFEVSTDKVDSEVPSPAGGVLTAILVEEGDTVDVGVTLAVIGDDAPADGSTPAASVAPAVPVGPPQSEPPSAAAPVDPPGATAALRVTPAPAAAPTLSVPPSPSPPLNGSGQGLVLSPVVRRLLS